MPRKALTRHRSSRDNATRSVTTETARERELAGLIKDRPDKPVLIRVRHWFLSKIEEEKEEIFSNFKEVMSGKASAALRDIEVLIHQLQGLSERGDKEEKRLLLQAINNLSDTARLQQSRERILSKMLDKLLVDTRESEDPGKAAGNGLFQGASINISYGGGIQRGVNQPQNGSEPIDITPGEQ